MKRVSAFLLGLLLPLLAAGGLLVQSGAKYSPPAAVVGVDTGAIAFTGVIDESTDRLDIPISGTALDVGAGDFSFLIPLRPSATGNNEEAQSTGASYGFPDTNIFADRDNTCSTRDWGCGLANGRVLCSVENSNGRHQVVGTTDIRDNTWHFIVFQRSASNGLLSLYVDGVRQAQATGPTGTISLPACASGHELSLVIGTEKHGFDGIAFGYVGLVGTIEIYNTLICTGTTCTVPSAPANPAASGLLGQWLLGEGSGTTAADSVGNNDGFIAPGGVPAWSNDTPFQ